MPQGLIIRSTTHLVAVSLLIVCATPWAIASTSNSTMFATGAALGGAQGGATALNVDANNRQLHATEKQRIKLLAKGNAKLEQELSDAACFKVHCSAAKNLDDASKAALLATEQAVQANAGGKYSQALALLEADSNSTGLFVYTPADKTLDALVAADPRSSGRASGLTREEMAAKAASLQACGTNARCIDQTNASYQRVASDRAEQALRIVMLTQRSRGCETDACQRETLAQMQALNNDLKAQGLGPQDSDRIALRAHMAATYAALGKPGASLDEFAAALIGTMGSEAGAKGVGAKGGVADEAAISTRFLNGVSVVDRKTGTVFNGTIDLQPTLDRIAAGATGLSKNDGAVFMNRQGLLPAKSSGYYKEYVVATPGINGPGPQRIVVGKSGEMYYTSDHYLTFIPIRKP